jgi:hypothetical protein
MRCGLMLDEQETHVLSCRGERGCSRPYRTGRVRGAHIPPSPSTHRGIRDGGFRNSPPPQPLARPQRCPPASNPAFRGLRLERLPNSAMAGAELTVSGLLGCHLSGIAFGYAPLWKSYQRRSGGASNEVIAPLMDGGGAGLVEVAPYVERHSAACFRSRFAGIEAAWYAESPVREVKADG